MEVTRAGHVGTKHQPSLALNSPYSVTSQAYYIPSVIYLPRFLRRMQFFVSNAFLTCLFHIEGWTTIWNQFENLFNMKPLTRFTFWSQILLTWEQTQRDVSDSSNSFGFREWRVYQTLTCATNSIQVVTCRVLFQNSDSNPSKKLGHRLPKIALPISLLADMKFSSRNGRR